MKKIALQKILSVLMVSAIAALSFTSCKKDDGPTDMPIVEEQTIFGAWEITDGSLVLQNAAYVHINEDNTINILAEDGLGFKREYTTNITVTENQLTMSSGYGSQINNYNLDGNVLTISPPGSSGDVTLTKNNVSPSVADWIMDLSAINEGNAPFDAEVDIAYNGTQLLVGNGYSGENIALVNPTTFAIEGEIVTTRSAFAVEVEKYNSTGKYIFQSDNGNDKFYGYREDDNSLQVESFGTGAWIKGLASIDENQIWVSSNSEEALYLYRYDGADEILNTINLDFQPGGLDYQNGFLYVSEGNRIHKCQTTPSFKAVETYRIQNHNVNGIAYDGANFWLSTYSSGSNKLVKIDLSI